MVLVQVIRALTYPTVTNPSLELFGDTRAEKLYSSHGLVGAAAPHTDFVSLGDHLVILFHWPLGEMLNDNS